MISGKKTRGVFSPKRRQRRRWWQVLLRAGIAAMLAGGVLYVLLPWLLPAETIRRKLEADLTGQLGAKVTVGAMRFRWDDGVVIDGLTVENPPGFSDEPMVRVGRIRCDFSPLRFVFQRRIAWMDVEKLVITARDDEAGRLNTDCLTRMKMSVETQRLRVRQSELSVFLHDQPRPLVARISDLQVLRTAGDLGRVTMTGSFEQAGTPAPISLRISLGDEEDRAATVDCRFSDLDLAQLPRSRTVWGDLPIESLRGRCGGQLVFALGKNLRVEELRLELLAENLEVKPQDAAPLPVIDEAGLRFKADLDALSERADVRKFHLRLPGVRLTGRGVIYADLLRGDWKALDRVRLRGTMYPDRLSTLMTGREALGDGWVVRGPVTFRAAARQRNDALGIELQLDAGETSIRTPTRPLKPTQQALRVQLKGNVGYAGGLCPIDVEQARLDVGGNTITAAGRIADLLAFRPPEAPENSDEHLATVLEALKGVSLRGTVDLNEPLVLMHPFFDSPPSSLELRGPWSGPWSFSPGTKPRFNLGLRGGAEAVLRFQDVLAKPKDQELTLELAAVVDPGKRNITNILFDAMTERGRLSLDDITIQLPKKGGSLQYEGKFEIDRVEAFRAWMRNDPSSNWTCSGRLKGSFGSEVIFAPRKMAVITADADLGELTFSLGEHFTKPAGEKAKLNFYVRDFYHDDIWDATLAATFGGGEFQIDSECDNNKDVVSTHVFADMKELSWLHASSPSLHRALDGGRLAGSLQADGSLRWDTKKRELTYAFKAGSKKLDCIIGGQAPIMNLQGKPVALSLKGRLRETSPEALLWEAKETSLSVAESSVEIPRLRAKLDRKKINDTSGNPRLLDACNDLAAEVWIVGDVDDLLGEVFPRWADWPKDYSLKGIVKTRGSLRADRETITAKLCIDAGDLRVLDVNGLTKMDDEKAIVELEITSPRDVSSPRMRRLSLKTDALHLDAQVRGKVQLNDAGLPVGIKPAEARIIADLKNAAALATFWSALEERKLTGRAKAKLHWKAGESEWGTVSELTFNAEELRGEYRGKLCRLDGSVHAEGMELLDEKTLHIERVTTDDLEFAAGDNHGWLLADVQLKPNAPSGTFHLLFETLDDKDLADWLSEPDSTAEPASTSLSRTEADVALQTRANRWIVQLHDLLKHADLTGRISAGRYHTYDSNVRQSYPTRDLELSLRVKDNDVQVRYHAGLYGGMVVGQVGTNLTVPAPVVTSRNEYMDVKATRTIQPQISRMFPGNTVQGQFSRIEDVHYSLRDLLCSVRDGGYRLCPEGTAKMVAADGVLVGQAAPDFVTKMFPGLNLTKYPYRTMTAFTKFLPSGATKNETFFYGNYDLYMEGVTRRDYTIQYTIGLVMLGSAFPPEALRDWKQGRIPILKVKGRIEDGKLVDDTVSYPLPNETLFEIFLKNNLVYRAWVNLQKKSVAGTP